MPEKFDLISQQACDREKWSHNFYPSVKLSKDSGLIIELERWVLNGEWYHDMLGGFTASCFNDPPGSLYPRHR